MPPVTDPSILEQLNSGQAQQAPATYPGVIRGAEDQYKQQDQQMDVERLNMERERLRIAQQAADISAANAQKPTATEIEVATKQEGQDRRGDTVRNIMGRVRELYAQDIEGQPLSRAFGATEYIDSLPANQRFSKAGQALLPLIRPLVAQTAREGDSDKEMEVFMSYIPQASDADITIEEKLSMLELLIGGMVDGKNPSEVLAEGGQNDNAPPRFEVGDGAILGNTHDSGGPGAPGSVIATGPQAREDDPTLAGIRDEYLGRLERGDDARSILMWAREAGVDPSAFPSIQEQVRFRKENPNVPVGEYDTSQLDDRFVNVSGASRAIGSLAQSAPGAYTIGAANALTGFNLDSIVGATGGNAEQARLGMDQISRQRPISSTLGTISGGVMGALGGEFALGRAGVSAGLARTLGADSAYGALAGAGMSDYAADGSQATMGDRLKGAGVGAIAGATGSYVGNVVGRGLGNIARGVTDNSVNALRQAGVRNLTVGQSIGNTGRAGAAIKGVEDRLSGIPLVGDMVNARRSEGLRQFNVAAFERALEPIGGTVQGKVGQDAVEAAQRQVSEAFSEALDGVGIVPDNQFQKDFSTALLGVNSIKGLGPEVLQDVVSVFKTYDNDPMLSGEAFQVISRELRDIKFSYRGQPRFKAVAAQVDKVERALFDMVDRQASGVVPKYNEARQAYRRLSILEDTVMKAQNQDSQVFTAAQLNRADTASGKKFEGKAAAARGGTPFNDMAVAGQEVLPNKVPDSGTAGRLLVPAALIGAGGASDASGATGGAGLTIGGILAALYTRTGQRLLTKPTRGMEPGTARRAALESGQTKRAIQAVSGAGAATAVTNRK